MNFDIISMKQRAKALMQDTKPNPKAVGLLFALFMLVYITAMFIGIDKENWIVIIVAEILYMNFRNCNRIYGLKISREEKSGCADVFSAFKENTFQMIVLSFIKDVLCAIGFVFFIVGAFVPFYCLRFATQVMYDEKISVFKALKRSSQLLKGHYGELVKLDITIIGWYILAYMTFGIAGFYAKPYSAIMYAEFYDYLKASEEMKF